MSLRLSLNLEQRCSLIQKLGIESDYLGTNFMVRTEYLLQKDKYEKGLLLIEKTDTGYESVMDWLLAMLAPSWKKHIKAYYEFRYTKLGDIADFKTITLMDQLMESAVVDLYETYKMLQEAGWLEMRGKTEPGIFMQRVTMDGIRVFIGPRFPIAPICVHHSQNGQRRLNE